MKKLGLIVSAFALMLGLSQCKKPNQPTWFDGTHTELIIFSNSDNSQQKGLFHDVGGLLDYHWDVNNDVIHVYATRNAFKDDGTTDFTTKSNYCGVLDEVEIINPGVGTEARFTGRLSIPNGAKAIRFVHYGKNVEVGEDGSTSVDYAAQTGLIADVSDNVIAYCDREYKGSIHENCPLEVAFAVVKFSFEQFSSDAKVKLITNGKTQIKVEAGGAIKYIKDGGMTFNFSETGEKGKNKNAFYTIMMPRGNTSYTFSDDVKKSVKLATINANIYYSNNEDGVAIILPTTDVWNGSVETIPVCAIHATCASSGGMVKDKNVSGIEEQGVIWADESKLGSDDLTLANCTTYDGGKYIFNGVCPNGTLTPKTDIYNTFTGFMSGLEGGKTYKYRAYIKKGDEVKYGETTGTLYSFTVPLSEPFPTTETVNFGHPNINWAKYNLGYNHDMPESTSAEKNVKYYGDYYMWGDNSACSYRESITSTENVFFLKCSWLSYRFAANNNAKFTKYCPSDKDNYWYSEAGPIDNVLELSANDDCVAQTLGDGWRLPTTDEWQELQQYNTFKWLGAGSQDKINPGTMFTAPVAGCLVVKGKTDHGTLDVSTYMFLPAAGYRAGDDLINSTTDGYLWSKSLSLTGPTDAYYLNFNNSPGYHSDATNLRWYGFPVRPVHP